MTDSLEQRVSEFICLHGIFADGGDILIAVSGGADSICLLHMLKSLRDHAGIQGGLVCGHVNHQLREQASDADERFVVEQAERLGLPVVARTVDVRSHAETNRLSIETAARQLRLAALEEIARKHGCSWIATGHQKNDNAETVLHRLRRGTGFRGLAGIRPVRRVTDVLWLARPLLCATREEIVRYLREHNVPWREDHTNEDIVFTRNYIRHRLLPLLQQESGRSLVEDLSQLALSTGRLYDRVQAEAERVWPATVQANGDEVRIEASRLASLPEPVAIELIRRSLVALDCGERDLTEHHYQGVLQLARLHPDAKRISLPNGFDARLDAGRIVLRKASGSPPLPVPNDAFCALMIPGRTQFGGYQIDAEIIEREKVDVTRIAREKGPFTEHLDWDRISPPVVVRPRRPGDRFQPLGLDGVAKVGKFLTTAKTPHDVRKQALIFADREKVLWVCPIRLAEPAKVTNATRQILRLVVAVSPQDRSTGA